MNVLEASERLFGWFSENDYFTMEEDFSQVNLISDTPDKDKGVYRIALNELEQNELIANVPIEDKECWVLKKPFTAFEQSVTISPPVAMGLSQVINAACDKFGDDTDYCSPANIQEKDVRNLLLLYSHVTSPEEIDLTNG
jgi:hypothetical protein